MKIDEQGGSRLDIYDLAMTLKAFESKVEKGSRSPISHSNVSV